MSKTLAEMCSALPQSSYSKLTCIVSSAVLFLLFLLTASEMCSLLISKNVGLTAAKWTRVKVGIRPHLTGH